MAESLKKGYAMINDQCSQEVRDKLEATSNWETTQRNQLLHKLICKIERICVGFNDHKQEVFNLVQALYSRYLSTTIACSRYFLKYACFFLKYASKIRDAFVR